MKENTLSIVIGGVHNSGGTDRVASIISDLLVNTGFQVNIYCLEVGTPYYLINKEVSIVHAPEGNYVKKCIFIANKIKKSMHKNVLVISMGKLSSIFIPLIKLRGYKGKVICNDHVSFESFSILKKIFKFISYLFSDALVVLTENDKQYLSKIINEKKIYVIRNISPFCDVVYSPYCSREKIAIAVGRLSYQKDFGRLIDVWAMANLLDWHLFIIGDGDEKNDLLHKIDHLGLKNISIIGAQKSIGDWYNKASVILMTSRYEGLPMVLIESKNYALPAIAINCKTGPNEIITNDGYVVDTNDSFVEKLRYFSENENLRETMSTNSIINSELYSSKKILEKWIKLFGDI